MKKLKKYNPTDIKLEDKELSYQDFANFVHEHTDSYDEDIYI